MKFNFDWSIVGGGAPYVTISSHGIAFNSTSISKLKSPEQIIVGFDEEQLVLGIKAHEGENSKPYEFASRIRNAWIRIGCRDFVKYLERLTGNDFSQAKRFVAESDAETGILIVDLKQGSEVAGQEEQ